MTTCHEIDFHERAPLKMGLKDLKDLRVPGLGINDVGFNPSTGAVHHGRITYSRMEKSAHSVTRGSRLELDSCQHDPIPPLLGKE